MASRIHGFDWAATSLGPMSEWPSCLKYAVEIMLPARAQIVMFWGPDFVALYNDAYAPTIGDKHPRALGRPARENWGELWGDLEPLLRRVLDHGEVVFAKDRPFYIQRHGYPETVYFDISYSPVRDEEGSIRGVLCIVNETTERLISVNALTESEERLQAIFSQTAGGFAQTDLSGRFVFVNNRYCEIVGYTEAELLKLRMQDITYPEDLPRNLVLFKRLTESGESFEIEKRYVRKDGGLVWVANSVSAIRDREGHIRQTVAAVVDISERKRAQEVERRLAAIIASSDDAILSTDLNMTIMSWNSGAEKLYGYLAEEVIGKPVTILVPEDRGGEEPFIIERIRAGQRVEPHETIRRRKDGGAVDVSLSVSPIYDAYGRIIGASKIARDITARKEAERLQAMLVGELNHRVKNVLATVAAIARQTFGREDANRNAADTFDARLGSLSRAHDLLTRGTWEHAGLRAVIGEAIAPYPIDSFDISGPEIQLAPKTVVSISLALHELATNAAKYGALSVAGGRVSIVWSLDGDAPARLKLRWQETGGPPVTAPSRRGFGSRLIESLLSVELKGEVQISYDPAGLVCEVTAPGGADWNSPLDVNTDGKRDR
ncbi:PAS domain-containing sensor histidine kinase [Sinorhizobium sp. BG8]|uniref:PAS domain-containing sensor histidine kinase n=1 Tax=Sinorhizobium sp. BG8 TaxID=2613773 RepID=UPI00193DD2F5|nr:PAS domain-containing sensor histidine kinase [Sinorhizobium sp. BG8]QRM56066.1 PAS domain S-box protein [Sinorhizobium sp. BG8]